MRIGFWTVPNMSGGGGASVANASASARIYEEQHLLLFHHVDGELAGDAGEAGRHGGQLRMPRAVSRHHLRQVVLDDGHRAADVCVVLRDNVVDERRQTVSRRLAVGTERLQLRDDLLDVDAALDATLGEAAGTTAAVIKTVTIENGAGASVARHGSPSVAVSSYEACHCLPPARDYSVGRTAPMTRLYGDMTRVIRLIAHASS
jgi:hypothetical protein